MKLDTPHEQAKIVTLARLQDEFNQIQAIYRTTFPRSALTFMLYEGGDPLHGAATIHDGAPHVEPAHLSPNFIGSYHVAGPSPMAPEKTIWISVPRKPTQVELQDIDGDWTPNQFSKLFAFSPISYENLRYRHEMTLKSRQLTDHQSHSLSYGPGIAELAPQPGATDKRPAILIGFHWLEVGGAEKLAFDCVKWALSAGLRVFIVASVPALQRAADTLPDHPDVTFVRLDRYLPHHLWAHYVQNLVHKENIRLVHIHHCVPLYAALPQLRATCPWVKVIDSTHIIEYADGGYPRISGVWSNFIDVHHVISRELMEYYTTVFHVPHARLQLGRMLAAHEGDITLPALNMRAGAKSLRVTFVGRLYYQKRPIVLAETLRALKAWSQKTGVTLAINLVGEGPFRRVLERLLRRYGLSGQVELFPAKTDVPALLSRSDILLLPSHNEGLALVCYEAIDAGCVPISTDVGGQKELVPAELLVPLDPRQTVKQTVATIDRLWHSQSALDEVAIKLHANRRALAAEPTAEEVMGRFYRTALDAATAQQKMSL